MEINIISLLLFLVAIGAWLWFGVILVKGYFVNRREDE